jgi:threonine/homoserine/homoserine lactone efflux protein
MESLLPLVSFAFVASITPGPNNLLLAASGVAFGWRRTLPHLLGIPVGFSALIAISGLGVGTLVTTVPAAGFALKFFGSAYLLYLAWIMRSAFAGGANEKSAARPIRFHEAALFQFANAKAWIMALSAVSIFVPDFVNPWVGLITVWACFVLVTLPCAFTWVTLGVAARKTLVNTRFRSLFSSLMVLLMIYTVASIWFSSI